MKRKAWLTVFIGCGLFWLAVVYLIAH
ncbi:YmiA family putative membrane protein [Salmonella enterica subsp. enterica serovar Braenderup]|nr:YmiA family putative membrane protein [Salmonella enterica subsp. enterica serovar Miami]EEJ3358300.1 YmiA family putative membrane protein [Salmonella enterica subsp. enterica serovar Braenderup]EGD2686326.1 YmiA family putative membrane protein [Salmonella enterica]EJL5265602.1 YmiA family putative membrane protein [Salmonella enterica]